MQTLSKEKGENVMTNRGMFLGDARTTPEECYVTTITGETIEGFLQLSGNTIYVFENYEVVNEYSRGLILKAVVFNPSHAKFKIKIRADEQFKPAIKQRWN